MEGDSTSGTFIYIGQFEMVDSSIYLIVSDPTSVFF